MDPSILTQLPAMLRQLGAIVQEPMARRRERRKEFLTEEIEPLHESMTAINADYMESFSELLGLLQSEEDMPRVVELLKKKRLVMLASRKDAAAFSEALAGVKKGGYIRQPEIDTFLKYAEAIKTYLRQASPVDVRVSWYTDFINTFEGMVERGRSPFGHFDSIETSRPPVEIVRRVYEVAVHEDIPSAWQEYSLAYRALRMTLKR